MIRKFLLAVALTWGCISAAYAGTPYGLSKDFEVAQLMGMAGGIIPSGPVVVQAECSLTGVSCAGAWSFTHEIVTGATKAFNISDSTGGAGHNVDIGFTSTGLVNTAAVRTFCNALAGDSPCYLTTAYDQTGNGCDLTYTLANAGSVQIYAPYNLPVYLIGYNAAALIGHLEKTSCATALGGNAAKSFIVSSNNFGSNSGAGTLGGLAENTAGVVTGSMFTGALYEPSSTVYTGFDLEGCGTNNPGCQNTSSLGNASYGGAQDIIAGTYDGASHYNIYENGTQTGTTWTGTGSFATLVTQNRMTMGTSGDNTSTGPAFIADYILNTGVLSGTTIAAITTSWQTLYSAQTAAATPIEIQGSLPAGLKNMPNITWGYLADGLRQLSSSYMGPLLNVCKGTSATCEDIPQDGSGNLAWSTAAAYCGSDATATLATSTGTTLTVAGTTTGTFAIGMQIQGTGFTNVTFITAGTGPTYTTNISNAVSVGTAITGNDCRVHELYGQAAQGISSYVANFYENSDMTDLGTAANRPWLYFNIPGVTTGKGGLYFNGAQQLCLAGGHVPYDPGSTNSAVEAAVAERTGAVTSYQLVTGTDNGYFFVGFASTANEAYAEYSGGGAGSVTNSGVADQAMHSLTYAFGSGVTTTYYTDATSGTSTAHAPVELNISTFCMGKENTGTAYSLTGYVEELYIYGGANFSSTDVSNLRANQRNYWGF